MRMNCFIRKIIHNRPPTHDDLPVLLVVGHLVGAPQLTETAATNLRIHLEKVKTMKSL